MIQRIIAILYFFIKFVAVTMEKKTGDFILLGECAGIVVQVLYAVHAMGRSNCIVVIPKETRHFGLTNMTRRCIYADFHGADDDYLIGEINQLASNMPDLIAIPCDCSGARILNRIGHRMKAMTIPTPTNAMLDRFDNKWQFYQFCTTHGLSVPLTQLTASKHDLDFRSAVRQLGLPLVFKPIDQAASTGVHVIYSEEEFRRKILDVDEYRFSPLLVQQYIGGLDIGVNLLSIHGRITAIAVQQRDMPQNFGAPIEFMSNPDAENAAHKICEISGYHGVMNIDARVDEKTGRVVLFESNPRFWGSLSASVWCGLNFVEACFEPGQSLTQSRRLDSGRASVHYHPIIQPRLWSQALFCRHEYKRQLVRKMMGDLWTFFVQFESLRQKLQRYLFRPCG